MIVKITDTFNKILSVFSTFGISDALDIILVAVIIYICVRIIRETRAMQLAKGFIFIAIVYGIVTLLDMEASSFIFKAIFSNILIILVILFGPELRNILEQIGKGTTAKSLKSVHRSDGSKRKVTPCGMRHGFHGCRYFPLAHPGT